MPRIPLLTDETMTPEQKRVHDFVKGRSRDNHVGAPYQLALHCPEFLERWQQVGEKPATAGPKPELKRLNDIKTHFHACWSNKTTGNPNVHAISVHAKNAQAAGLDVKQHGADLLAALKLSNSWRVLPAVGGELCRIELP